MFDTYEPLLLSAAERAELLRELGHAGIALPGLTPTEAPAAPPRPAPLATPPDSKGWTWLKT
jgi:hypothetical protein